MTQSIINIGAAPNDGTGDAVRSSFDKCNLNFTELYQVSRPTGNAIEYVFNNTATEPPSTGQIRFNQATQASTTKLWASHTTSSGVNIKQFLAAATTGAKLVLQDKIDNTNYIKFNVTAAPVDKTTYWEFTVTATASSGNLPNAAILAAVTAGASGIDAAPFDALAYNGMQINGSMEVSQESGTTAVTVGATTYVVDGWLVIKSGTMVLSAQQVADAPPGFSNSLKLTVSTAQAVLSSSSVYFEQRIEGYRTSRMAFGTANAQSVSIGFWTKIHRTGMYSGSIRNAAANRGYPFTFTQNVADTWEFKTVTIPGDTTGTWIGNTVGIGLHLFICVAADTLLGTANSWVASNVIGATGTTNGVAATSDTFQITGVIILPGIGIPSAACSPFILRSYDRELVTCQRYFRPVRYGTGIAYATTSLRLFIPHFGLRATPTANTTAGITVSDIVSGSFTQSAPGMAASGNADGGQYDFGGFTGLTINKFYAINNTSVDIQFSARL